MGIYRMANPETNTSLSEYLRRIAEAARQAAQAKGRGATTAEQKSILEKIFRSDVAKAKEASRDYVRKARSGEAQKVVEAEEHVKRNKFTVKDAVSANEELRLHKMNAGIVDNLPPEVSRVEMRYSAVAADLVSSYASLPVELRDDPYVLKELLDIADGSFDFHSATGESLREYRSARNIVMRHLTERITALGTLEAGLTQDFAGVENDGIFGKRFDLYRLHQLEVPQETPKPKKPGDKDKNNDAKWEKYRQDMKKWTEENAEYLQKRDLASDLAERQRELDSGRLDTPDDELRELQEYEKKLRNGKDLRDVEIEGVHIRKSQYSPEDADVYLERIYQRKQLLDAEIQEQRQTVYQEQQRQHREDQPFSTIYLSSEDAEKLINNPAAFFDPKLRELVSRPGDLNDFSFQTAMNRLKLAGEMYADDYFDRAREGRFAELFKNLSPEEISQIELSIQRLSPDVKRRLSKYVSNQIDALYANYHLTASGDLKEFQKRIQSLGDAGINLLDASEGGLVGVWRGRYERILKDVVGNDKRLSTQHEEIAFRKAVKQLLEEQKLYIDQRRKFYQTYQMPGTNLDSKEYDAITESAAGAIIKRSMITWRLRMRKAVIMEQGLGPGAGDWMGGVSSYATLSIEEKMLGAARIRDWFFRKWGYKREVVKIWNKGAYFSAKADDRIWDLVGHETDQLWDLYTSSPADAAGQVNKRKALEKIAYIIKMNEFSPDVETISPPGDAKFETKLLDYLKKRRFKKKDLEEYVAIEEGGFRMQWMFRPYFYLDSLWREGTYDRFIKLAYEHGDKMFLGAGLRQKGEKYFFSPIVKDHHRHEEMHEFVGELARVAKYRPQGIAEFLSMGGDEAFSAWFAENRTTLGISSEQELFTELNRRFLMINHLVIKDNGEPIDYSSLQELLAMSGMTPESRGQYVGGLPETQAKKLRKQFGYLDQAFAVEGGKFRTKEQYLSAMDALYRHLDGNGQSQIAKLSNIKYDRFFLTLAWEDDIPVQYLEDPQNIEGLKEEYIKQQFELSENDDLKSMFYNPDGSLKPFSEIAPLLIPISGLTTEEGVGVGSPLSRAWGDYGLAMGLFDQFADFRFGTDKKKFLELMQATYKSIDAYQGPFLGAESVIKMTAAWLGSAQVKKNYGDFFTGLMDSSVFKEVYGGNAPSLSLDNVHEVIEEIEELCARLDTNAPHMMHALEKYLRLSNVSVLGVETGISWQNILKSPIFNALPDSMKNRITRGYPLGLWQYKIFLASALFAVIIAVAAANEFKKGKEEAHN